MNVQEAIAARRSVRQYADKLVTREVIDQLLNAAVHAPSAMDSQTWAFGVILGFEQVHEIGERARVALLKECDRQGMTGGFRDRIANPSFNPFYGAPAVVVIYATMHDQFAAINCTLAAENLMLVATELGLGTCWIGSAMTFFNNTEVKREFGVPEGDEAIAVVIVGYPAGETPEKPKNPPNVLYWK
jgi:nitroreductase